MVSAGIDSPLASLTALRSLGLPSMSPPPMRAATVISLISLVKSLPRLASSAPFFRLIVAHLEWPLMLASLRARARGDLPPSKMAPQASERPLSRQPSVGRRELRGSRSGLPQGELDDAPTEESVREERRD